MSSQTREPGKEPRAAAAGCLRRPGWGTRAELRTCAAWRPCWTRSWDGGVMCPRLRLCLKQNYNAFHDRGSSYSSSA